MDEGRGYWGEKCVGERIDHSPSFPSPQPYRSFHPSYVKDDHKFKSPQIAPIHFPASQYSRYPEISSHQNQTPACELEKSNLKAKIRQLAESRSKARDVAKDGSLHRSLSDTKLNSQDEFSKFCSNQEARSMESQMGFEKKSEMLQRWKSMTMLKDPAPSIDIYTNGKTNGVIPRMDPSSISSQELSRSWGSAHDLTTPLHQSLKTGPHSNLNKESFGNTQHSVDNRTAIHSSSSNSMSQKEAEAFSLMVSETRRRQLLDMYSKAGILKSDRNLELHKDGDTYLSRPHSLNGVPLTLMPDTNPMFSKPELFMDSYLPYLGTPLNPHSKIPSSYLMNGHLDYKAKSKKQNDLDCQKRKNIYKYDDRDGLIPKKKKKKKVRKEGKESSEVFKDERKTLETKSPAFLQMQAKVHKLLNMKEQVESKLLSPPLNGVKCSSDVKSPPVSSCFGFKWDMNIMSPNKTVNDIPVPDCCGVCKDRGVRYSPHCLNKSSKLPNEGSLTAHLDKIRKMQSSSSQSQIDRSCDKKIEELLANAMKGRSQKLAEGTPSSKEVTTTTFAGSLPLFRDGTTTTLGIFSSRDIATSAATYLPSRPIPTAAACLPTREVTTTSGIFSSRDVTTTAAAYLPYSREVITGNSGILSPREIPTTTAAYLPMSMGVNTSTSGNLASKDITTTAAACLPLSREASKDIGGILSPREIPTTTAAYLPMSMGVNTTTSGNFASKDITTTAAACLPLSREASTDIGGILSPREIPTAEACLPLSKEVTATTNGILSLRETTTTSAAGLPSPREVTTDKTNFSSQEITAISDSKLGFHSETNFKAQHYHKSSSTSFSSKLPHNSLPSFKTACVTSVSNKILFSDQSNIPNTPSKNMSVPSSRASSTFYDMPNLNLQTSMYSSTNAQENTVYAAPVENTKLNCETSVAFKENYLLNRELERIKECVLKSEQIPTESKNDLLNRELERIKEWVLKSEQIPAESKNDLLNRELERIKECILKSEQIPTESVAEKENILNSCDAARTKSNISTEHNISNSNLLSEVKPENMNTETKENVSGKEAKLEHLAWVASRVQKLKSMVTGEVPLFDRLTNNQKVEIPKCGCKGPDYVVNEELEGPYYTHLGAARSIQAIREMMEKRTGVTGKALRLEKIRYTGKEGKSSRGCPIAKWIIRRSGPEEKYLCVVRQRQGHYCDTACLIVVIVAWEGVPADTANDMYSHLVHQLPKLGFETERRCGTNERRTCACQGVDLAKRGASFSFGCSWSMYFNGCKFARSRDVRKFKLKDTSQEGEMETRFQNLATVVGPLYKQIAPDAYDNQTAFESVAKDCRLGNEAGRPFSGVTACVDFCAHAHKDLHNMNNGSTVVVTLTKHRGFDKPDDEQLHVLPLYVMDMCDEYGNHEAQVDKIRTGALEVLQHYPLEARIRSEPLTPCKKRGAKSKKAGKDSPASKKGSPSSKGRNSAASTPQGKVKGHLNSSSSDLYFDPSFSGQQMDRKMKQKLNLGSEKYGKDDGRGSNKLTNKKQGMSYDDMALHGRNSQAFYQSFWNYFNCFGTFPPPSFVNSWAMQRKGILNDDVLANEISPSVISQDSKSSSFQSIDTQLYGASYRGRETFNQGHAPEEQKQMGNDLPLDLSSGSGSNLKCSLDAISSENVNLEKEKKHNINTSLKTPAPEVYDSPLHLLSEAVFLRTKNSDEENRQQNINHSNESSKLPQNMSREDNSFPTSVVGNERHNFNSTNGTSLQHSTENKFMNDGSRDHPKMGWINANPPMGTNGVGNFHPTSDTVYGTESTLDPTVVKCEWEYNEEAFHDQEMGGVAVALSHGAVLFEVAKRELHATTGLRNPNRYAPTRISLVFYQHKKMNRASHGWYEYEQKLEALKQSRLEKLKEDKNSIIPALDLPDISPRFEVLRRKKKSKKEEKLEKLDLTSMPSVEYKYLWEGPLRRAVSLTTDSVITRWIDPQPMVTGPYQRWV